MVRSRGADVDFGRNQWYAAASLPGNANLLLLNKSLERIVFLVGV